MWLSTIAVLVYASLSHAHTCKLSSDLVKEIRSYQGTVNQIINATTKGLFKGKTYDELAYFVDKFGARQSGSQALEDSIEYLLDLMQSTGYDLENVHGENVTIPHWIRSNGPSKAAKYGAIATLIRSVTPFSLNTLHTGLTEYEDSIPKIAAASITIEDARMLQRIQDRGDKIVLKLNIQTQNLDPVTSRNVVAEIKGSRDPEKVVLVSGHIDSWDVGVGALDDGGGAFISWYALRVLKALGLKPKRTLRSVLWTAEEEGLIGVQAYDKAHKDELDKHIFVMESDEGVFTPLGLEYVAGHEGECILKEVLKLLAPINATQTKLVDSAGSDITIWKNILPTATLLNRNENYFWYHHTEADTMDVFDPAALDRATALWASVAYVLADLNKDFPRQVPK
ncbi:carboxypeptidase Q-like isoform X2 [Diabrotica virgifera virgifera]|uniref:Carboxypeptidase Q n=1 Tax=Diabrotica virgifera virgifera TaxID=50390 RepID=A0ABM5L8A0_DIAVI|nr:carboxypeptidase Q-like isoform X2 [Diabrotica virgifera virgifera]